MSGMFWTVRGANAIIVRHFPDSQLTATEHIPPQRMKLLKYGAEWRKRSTI
jgi:hypothetical protein